MPEQTRKLTLKVECWDWVVHVLDELMDDLLTGIKEPGYYPA